MFKNKIKNKQMLFWTSNHSINLLKTILTISIQFTVITIFHRRFSHFLLDLTKRH